MSTITEPPVGSWVEDDEGDLWKRTGQGWQCAGEGWLFTWADLTAAYTITPYVPRFTEVICADCGAHGETTGHMGCQYPQDHD